MQKEKCEKCGKRSPTPRKVNPEDDMIEDMTRFWCQVCIDEHFDDKWAQRRVEQAERVTNRSAL